MRQRGFAAAVVVLDALDALPSSTEVITPGRSVA